MVEALRRNKKVQVTVNKLLWLKKNKPALYGVISFLTDSIILGLFLLTSLCVAFYMTYKGYTNIDSALMAVCIADINIILLSCISLDLNKRD